MTFDIINYTYSGLISIFSMIMGMAYPLMNTVITEIDTKYGGNRFSEKVLSEPEYIRLRAVLAISIVVSILTPFVLYYLSEISIWMYYWVMLQTIVVLLLVIAFIQLYDLIIRYKLPNKFIEYNGKKDSIQKDVVCLAEIARYAARRNDTELYLQSTIEVVSRMFDELQNGKIQSTLTSFYPSVYKNECRLSKETKEALAIYTSIVCDSRIKEGVYRTDCSLLNLFFSTTKTLLAGDRLIIWKTVQDAARNGNDAFVKQYWIYAVQYYSLFDKLRNYYGADAESKKSLRKEKEAFHKFHTAILGMLLYFDRKEIMIDLFYYSRTLPYTYPLCCNCLQGIFDEWKIFYNNGDTMSLMLQLQDYPLVGNEHGVDSEWILLHIMERMLAIQILRLKGIDYNVEYKNPLDDIVEGNLLEEKRSDVALLERMKNAINQVCSDGYEMLFNAHIHFTKEEAINLIEKNIKRIEEQIKDKEENPSVDVLKITKIKSKIQEIWNRTPIDLGISQEGISYETEYYERKIEFDLPKEMVCIGYKPMNIDGFVDSLVKALTFSIERVAVEAFKRIGSVVTYRIEYQDIGLAIEKLKLSSNYVILYNSINFDFYYECYKQYKGFSRVNVSESRSIDGAILKEQYSYESYPYIIILKRESLPYLTIGRNDEDYDEKRQVETNIEIMSTDVESLSQRYIKAIVGLHYPKDLRYVRIDIPYVVSEMDIEKIRPIDNILN